MPAFLHDINQHLLHSLDYALVILLAQCTETTNYEFNTIGVSGL